jgi:hypothetical protein
MRKTRRALKVVDDTTFVRCTSGRGVIREEVWQDEIGEIVRYNLAFILHSLYSADNGRVLGYDNRHGHHHRHFMGKVESFSYKGYDLLMEQFLAEVQELRKEGQ